MYEEWAYYFDVFFMESLTDETGDGSPYKAATIVLGRPFPNAQVCR